MNLFKTEITYRDGQKVQFWLTYESQRAVAGGFGPGVRAISVTTYSVPMFGAATANDKPTTIDMDKIGSVRGVSSRSVKVR